MRLGLLVRLRCEYYSSQTCSIQINQISQMKKILMISKDQESSIPGTSVSQLEEVVTLFILQPPRLAHLIDAWYLEISCYTDTSLSGNLWWWFLGRRRGTGTALYQHVLLSCECWLYIAHIHHPFTFCQNWLILVGILALLQRDWSYSLWPVCLQPWISSWLDTRLIILRLPVCRGSAIVIERNYEIYVICWSFLFC